MQVPYSAAGVGYQQGSLEYMCWVATSLAHLLPRYPLPPHRPLPLGRPLVLHRVQVEKVVEEVQVELKDQ